MASLRRTDLLALSNLREDGRKPGEIRRMRIQLGPLATTSGSALVHMGLTTVLASCRGPMECAKRSDERHDRAVLEVSCRQTPFASGDRRVTNANTDRRLIELSHLIQKAMEAAVQLELHPRSRIVLELQVLADDGGRLCAAINAASLALVYAGIPMKDMVCSCSAGMAGDGTLLVDLNRRERQHAGQVFLPCAMMVQRRSLVLAQCEARLPLKQLERVLAAATEGCETVFEIMQASVRERASVLLAARNGTATVEVSPSVMASPIT